MPKNKIKLLAKEIKKLSKTKNYSIKIESKTDRIFDSKIGGIPYWTPSKNYPTNSEGKKLFLLAQINFDQEKVFSPLPKNGILQFFINDDDLLGLNFDDQTIQENFRVVYHESIDYKITKEIIEQLGAIDGKKANNFPVIDEYKISLHSNSDYVTLGDFHFNKFFSMAYKNIYKKELKEDDNYEDLLKDYEIDELEEELATNQSNHKMLGYSFFTQEDPRLNEKYKDYDILLFQLESEEQYLMWGDCGVGNFFIPQKSLEEKDFSKILYNWDCS